jgi:hypothetical protein
VEDTEKRGVSCSRTHRYESSSKSDKRYDRKYSCSKCYKRQKLKRASIGVQCRRDKTCNKYISRDINCSSKSTKYGKYINIETYPNGGATVVHMYQDEIQSLSSTELQELADEFFKVTKSLILDFFQYTV